MQTVAIVTMELETTIFWNVKSANNTYTFDVYADPAHQVTLLGK